MAKPAKREVKIRCEGSSLAEIDSLEAMQGDLKTLSKDNYLKLRGLIEAQGFSFPVFVWRDGKRLCLLDGHMRLSTLKNMRDEGWHVPPIPIAEVKASTLKEAQEKLLAAASQFGKVDRQGLYEFIQNNDIDLSYLKSSIDLPELNIPSFEAEFYSENLDGSPDQGSSDGGSKELGENQFGGQERDVACPECGHEFKV